MMCLHSGKAVDFCDEIVLNDGYGCDRIKE